VSGNLIGIFSDVHCNIDALEKMFENEPNVETWVCAGDSVGLFPCINETVGLLRKKNLIAIQGDHEESILSGEELKHSFSGNQSLRIQEKIINRENLEFLSSLPTERIVSIRGSKFLILHDLNRKSGSKYLFDFEKISNLISEDIEFVIFGNTHIPTFYKGRTKTFINPGSLGFPIQFDGAPSYALLDMNDQSLLFKQIVVNQERVLRGLRDDNYNQKFIDYLENGYVWTSQ
jgi:putative phosphoesterase